MMKKTVVLLVHGIRDYAYWQKKLCDVFSDDVIVRHENYGFMKLPSFLFSRKRHAKVVDRVKDRIADLRLEYKEDTICVVAHSFGTYAVINALEQGHKLKIDRLLLMGGIVPRNHDLQLVADRAKHVLNDCGYHDIWPVFAGRWSKRFGASGTFGFQSDLVTDRFHKFGHGGFFRREYAVEYWTPFIERGEVVKTGFEPDKPWLLTRALNRFPLKLATFIVVALSLLLPVSFFGLPSLVDGRIEVAGINTYDDLALRTSKDRIISLSSSGHFRTLTWSCESDSLSLEVAIGVSRYRGTVPCGRNLRLGVDRRHPRASASTVVIPDEQIADYVGQLFMVGFRGTCLECDGTVVDELVRRHGVGSIILYRHNTPLFYHSPTDRHERRRGLMRMINSIKTAGWHSAPRNIPTLIAVDQEGGDTQQIQKDIVSLLPAAMAVGSTLDDSTSFRLGRSIARQLRSLGIHMNLAPVADINVSPQNNLIEDRSFGGSAGVVGPMAVAFYLGQREAGLLSSAKHFPGHGGTRGTMSSPPIPISEHVGQQLQTALEPFRLLVDEGIQSVMSSHFRLSRLGKGRPVTFDPVFAGILKDTAQTNVGGVRLAGLGFNGVLVSDDLLEPAVIYNDGEKKLEPDEHLDRVFDTVVQAFEAGHDLLILGSVRATEDTEEVNESGFVKDINVHDFGVLLDRFAAYVTDKTKSIQERTRRRKRFDDALARVFSLKEGLDPREPTQITEERLDSLSSEIEHEIRTTAELIDSIYISSYSFLGDEIALTQLFKRNAEDSLLVFFPARRIDFEAPEGHGNIDEKSKLQVEHHFAGALSNLGSVVTRWYPRQQADNNLDTTKVKEVLVSVAPAKLLFMIKTFTQWRYYCYTAMMIDSEPLEFSGGRQFDTDDLIGVVRTHPTVMNDCLYDTGNRVPTNVLVVYSGSVSRRNAEVLAQTLGGGDERKINTLGGNITVKIPGRADLGQRVARTVGREGRLFFYEPPVSATYGRAALRQ